DKDAMVTTIVTGDLGKEISRKYGVRVYETLTGFKYVCGKANDFEKTGEAIYVFGYEESIGYCPETFTRDKDAVSTAMLLFEMTAYYKAKGQTLYEVLMSIYEEFGHYRESQFSVVYKGSDGAELKEKVMEQWRLGYPMELAGEKLVKATDYLSSVSKDLITGKETEVDIPKSDVLKYTFDGGTWYAVRPSGTEPKLKIYIYTVRDNEEEALRVLSDIESTLREKITGFEKA
ncbi:MAG: phospho-sugar mutase, partial [Clostridia bacterium]|nr:phospho-sugar mutase [Clostridia bacterium]